MNIKKHLSYRTRNGSAYKCTVEDFFQSNKARSMAGKTQLIFTSPPFPLLKKKNYGNKIGHEYVEWFAGLANQMSELLTEDGSIVVEIGNSWVQGEPVMSTAPLKALLEFMEAGDLHLCQQFVCHNPARLPSPIEWVNKERIRVKDSYTHIWWMSPTTRPKANNRNVLRPYSRAMERLLAKGSYNGGKRPSSHVIGQTSFLNDNGGAIPPSVIDRMLDPEHVQSLFEDFQMEECGESFLEYSNTVSSSDYRTFCLSNGLPLHPAVMNEKLAEFFIRFLTDEGDLIYDPFGGSNTTGAAAEKLNRKWVITERDETDDGKPLNFLKGSRGRFPADTLRPRDMT
jgi:hypothetical protein